MILNEISVFSVAGEAVSEELHAQAVKIKHAIVHPDTGTAGFFFVPHIHHRDGSTRS